VTPKSWHIQAGQPADDEHATLCEIVRVVDRFGPVIINGHEASPPGELLVGTTYRPNQHCTHEGRVAVGLER